MSQFFPGPVAVHAALFGKWELTTYNAFSTLSDEMPTTSQSSLEMKKGIRQNQTDFEPSMGFNW